MLNRCIAVDQDAFAASIWGRRPLLSTADALPRAFDDLLSPHAVDELIAERGVRAPFIRMAKNGSVLAGDCFLGPAGLGAEMPDQVDSAKVLAEFAAGATIVLQGLHRLWPPIIDFARALVDDVGHPVQANAYITPPANRGFDPHYDVHDVFVLQVAGSKKWTVHEPVLVDPLPNQTWGKRKTQIDALVRDTEPTISATLEPGDVLYLPRGWVHSAEALGQTSIHLTIGVSALTVYDAVRALTDELAARPALRQSLPMGLEAADSEQLVAWAEKAMATLIDELADDSAALHEAAAQRLTSRFADRTRPAAVRPLATLDTLDSLGAEAAVRWRHGLIARLTERTNGIDVRLRDRTISFPESCGPALRTLYDGFAHNAQTLPGLDTADSIVLLRRLLRESVVVPEPAAGV